MPGPSLSEERQSRIAELERRRPFGVGVGRVTALVCLLAAAGLLWLQWRDAAYFFSPRAPITLGAEGDYHLERSVPNRYVQVHGVPATRAAYFEERGSRTLIVGLQNTPLFVKRATLPTEDWAPGKKPPPPDPRPFAVRGRLLAPHDAARYEEGLKGLAQGPHWIISESERPGEDLGAAAVTGLLLAFCLLNAWFLVSKRRVDRV